jgi:hypothetical protein
MSAQDSPFEQLQVEADAATIITISYIMETAREKSCLLPLHVSPDVILYGIDRKSPISISENRDHTQNEIPCQQLGRTRQMPIYNLDRPLYKCSGTYV